MATVTAAWISRTAWDTALPAIPWVAISLARSARIPRSISGRATVLIRGLSSPGSRPIHDVAVRGLRDAAMGRSGPGKHRVLDPGSLDRVQLLAHRVQRPEPAEVHQQRTGQARIDMGEARRPLRLVQCEQQHALCQDQLHRTQACPIWSHIG